MQPANFLDPLKSQLSLKEGITKIHYIVLAVIVVILFLLFPAEKPIEPALNQSPMITSPVLKAIREQNVDKRLEYAESKPIIESMKKHLYQFDSLQQTSLEKAYAPLLVVKRRLFYLKNKGLDVSDAEKIIDDHMNQILTTKSD